MKNKNHNYNKNHKRCGHFDGSCTKYYCKNDKGMGKFKGSKVAHLGFYGEVVELNGRLWHQVDSIFRRNK